MRIPQSRSSLAAAMLTLASLPALAAFVMRPAVPPQPQNATITFHVHTAPGSADSGTLGQTTSVVLAVSKPGRTPLVTGQPTAGQVDGTHSFSSGNTAAAISQYYGDLLAGSGWVAGVDFLLTDNSIHFYSVGAISLDCNHRQLYAGLSVGRH